MKSLNGTGLSALALVLGFTIEVHADVRLPAIFADHMVLQRDATLPVWGWAEPGEAVTVSLGDTSAKTIAGADGKWRVDLAQTPATAEPQVLTITGKNSLKFEDVLVGEVWLCSGQSNMDWKVGGAANAGQEIAAAAYPQLRMFSVGRRPALTPQSDCEGRWIVCSPTTAGGFTAVGYYFGRELMQKLDVPVGLIDAAWGGTRAEPWTSLSMLKRLPGSKEEATQYEHALEVGAANPDLLKQERAAAEKALPARLAAWYQDLDHRDPGIQGQWMAPGYDLSAWRDVVLPCAKTPNPMGSFLGALWCRKEVEIPAAWVGKELELHLGAIDEVDDTYVNGVHAGRTWFETPEFWKVLRVYPVPAEVFTGPHVSVTVRVLNKFFETGFFGPADQMFLVPKEAAGSKEAVSLAGLWRYTDGLQIEHREIPKLPPAAPPVASNAGFANLFNGMIHPLIPYAIGGVIWYQGESNADAGNYFEYQELFSGLIGSWREAWGVPSGVPGGGFPFVFVQLANYMKAQELPVEKASWAELREAQLLTLQKVPGTYMAVTIDIGSAESIHPANKQDVGLRLALPVLARVYGRDVEYSGPVFKKLTAKDGKAILRFDHARGLKSRSGNLPAFAVAGADKVFHHARAEVDGETVIVGSDAVPAPVAVRYGWANNPECQLVNAADLPASPFRTDDWADFSVEEAP